MEDEKIIKFVKRSIKDILEKDSLLFINNVNEPTISYKLGQYLQTRFKEYNVDCEYNRNVEDEDLRKKIYLQSEGEAGSIESREVRPDIIIHKRGLNTHNLCVLEIKKNTSSSVDIEFDRTKLKAYTTDQNNNLNYQIGFLIIFTVLTRNEEYQIEVFKNGEQIREY